MKNFQTIETFLEPYKNDATWGTSIQAVLGFIKQPRENELSKEELIAFCRGELHKRNWYLTTYNWEHLEELIKTIETSFNEQQEENSSAEERVSLFDDQLNETDQAEASSSVLGRSSDCDAEKNVTSSYEGEEEDLSETGPLRTPENQNLVVELSSDENRTQSESENESQEDSSYSSESMHSSNEGISNDEGDIFIEDSDLDRKDSPMEVSSSGSMSNSNSVSSSASSSVEDGESQQEEDVAQKRRNYTPQAARFVGGARRQPTKQRPNLADADWKEEKSPRMERK